jgi:hypothetical protein
VVEPPQHLGGKPRRIDGHEHATPEIAAERRRGLAVNPRQEVMRIVDDQPVRPPKADAQPEDGRQEPFEEPTARRQVERQRADGDVEVPAPQQPDRLVERRRPVLAADDDGALEGLVVALRVDQAEVLPLVDHAIGQQPDEARLAAARAPEPSRLFTMREEFASLLPRAEVAPLAKAAGMLEEALATEMAEGRVPASPDRGGRVAHLHGHCHQKAFGAMGAVETVLRAIPGLEVRPIESSCCGMAGAFGYRSEHIEASLAMGEAALFPALRAAEPDDIVVADGTSCRHQIRDGTGREARHGARVLAEFLDLSEAPTRQEKGGRR